MEQQALHPTGNKLYNTLYFFRYGNIVPRTQYGKIATMLYAVLGIPVYILYFKNMGKVSRGVMSNKISVLILKGLRKCLEVDLSSNILLDHQKEECSELCCHGKRN